MSTAATKTPTRSEALIDAYLAGSEKAGDLYPGTAARVRDQLLRASGDPPQALGAALQFFEGRSASDGQLGMPGLPAEEGRGRHFLNPEASSAPPMAPLRKLLDRLAKGGYIKASAVEPLFKAHAADMAGLPPSTMGERVGRLLEKRDNWSHLVVRPELPSGEQETLEILEHFRSEGYIARHADLEEVAAKWTGELRHLPYHQRAHSIAKRLQMGHYAADLAPWGKPPEVDWSDAIFRERKLTAEERAANPLAYMF